MSTNYLKSIFNRISVIMVILTLVFSLTGTVMAAGAQPFIGIWRAIDNFDQSIIYLKISGPTKGEMNISWTESYFSFCEGQPGLATGKGIITSEDPMILEADMNLVCFSSGDTIGWHQVWTYKPEYNVLSSLGDYDVETVWTRPGKPLVPRLDLRVNYGVDDWVESFYEGGHTVWLTVTESDGVTIKATAELVTEVKESLGWETGFQTQDEKWSGWDPEHPDILPGDWVFAEVDNGQTAKVQVGDIQGMVNFETNSISGTITAPWFETPADFDYFAVSNDTESWRDEFNGSLSEGWEWVNENPNNWEFVDDSKLRIYNSTGATGSENLLLLPVEDTDFIIETYLSFKPNRDFQFAGLVIWMDETNFLQFGRAFCDIEGSCVGNGIYFDYILDGELQNGNFATHEESSEIYLRLVRTNGSIEAYASSDGSDWNSNGTHFILDGFQVNAVGLTSAQDFYKSELEVECHSWGADLPEEILVYDLVYPDGNDVYTCPWKEEEWNIQPGQNVGVAYTGPDGHWVANAFYPNSRFVASVVGNWLWTSEFRPESEVNVTVFNNQDDTEPLFGPITQTTDESGFTSINFNDYEYTLLEDNYITVSDSAALKGLVLEYVSVDIFDTEKESMAGYAPIGADVWAAAGPQDWQERIMVQADLTTGYWFADFDAIGFDITVDMQPWSFAQSLDDDGDANEGDPPPLLISSYTSDEPISWEPGDHSYQFFNGTEPITDFPVKINVSADADLYEGYVLLRPLAMRVCIDGELQTILDPIIRPDQATRFNVGYVTEYTMTSEEAEEYFDSLNIQVFLDGGEKILLTRSEIMPYNYDDWQAYLCGLTIPE